MVNPPFDENYRVYANFHERFGVKKSGLNASRYLDLYGTMFLTQPPATKATIVIEYSRSRVCTSTIIVNPDGIRWQQVLDKADKSKGAVNRILFPDEVVVTPEVNEQFEAWVTGSDGIGSQGVGATS